MPILVSVLRMGRDNVSMDSIRPRYSDESPTSGHPLRYRCSMSAKSAGRPCGVHIPWPHVGHRVGKRV